MLKKILVVLATTAAALCANGVARPEDVINLLVANDERTTGFQAKFIQRMDTKVYRGDISVKKGGKFRITYRSPVDQVRGANGLFQETVCNGKMLWTYIPRSRVVAEQKLSSPSGPKTSSRLVSDYNFSFFDNKRDLMPLNAFRAADLGKHAGSDESYLATDARRAYHMVLKPKPGKQRTDKAGFSTLHVWIDETGMVLRSLGVSTTGNVVEYVFTDIDKNVEIPDSAFDFIAPQGEQVMHNVFVPDVE